MTPEQLREAAAVMLAASEGKAIQQREYGDDPWRDLGSLLVHISWNWNRFQYRIKPEPRKVKVRLYNDGHFLRACTPDEKPREHWKPCSDIVEIEVKDE